MASEQPAQEGWVLGPQDEVGRWVSRPARVDEPFAIHGRVSFHIGGVHGWEEEAQRVLAILNALEARAEADRQAREDAIAAERATYDLMLSRAIEANVQRDRAETAEARLVRCGGENCMGFDASKPGWPVARWVREERLQAAEAERDALRARAELAIEAALWAGLYERDILEDPAAELHEWQGFKATWGKSEHSGDCTNQANACLRCHVELVVETAATLTTPAVSQEEGP